MGSNQTQRQKAAEGYEAYSKSVERLGKQISEEAIELGLHDSAMVGFVADVVRGIDGLPESQVGRLISKA